MTIAEKIAKWQMMQNVRGLNPREIELTKYEAYLLSEQIKDFFWYEEDPITFADILKGKLKFYNMKIVVLGAIKCQN